MPLYEYECERHGPFTLTRPMALASAAGSCPSCGAPSGRVITAPHVFTMNPTRRDAIARNEKSRHEPHVCTSGCDHRRAAPSGRGRGTGAGRPARRAAEGGLQAYTGPRPWVVEHR